MARLTALVFLVIHLTKPSAVANLLPLPSVT